MGKDLCHSDSGALNPSFMNIPVVAQRSPDSAVAFEATAKGNLPHTVTLTHALGALNIGEHIPAAYASRELSVQPQLKYTWQQT